MGRRPATIRDAQPALAKRTRRLLRWAMACAVLLFLGCVPAANAQASSIAAASPEPSGGDQTAAAAVRVRVANNFAKLPLSFEANGGQTDPQVKFLARGPGYTLFLTRQEAVFAFASPARTGQPNEKPRASALRLRFEGGDPNASISGVNELPGKTNYFLTSDRSTWHTGIANYSRVSYQNLYPGVNAIFQGNPQRLEFDFDVAPGADPTKIALGFEGGRVLRVDNTGGIVLGLGKSGRDGEVTLGRPVVYQQIGGARREIAGRFVLRGRHRIGFALGNYDRAQPLVIDPTLIYSTYLAGSSGSGQTDLQSIAADSSGSAYVAGYTDTESFPGPSGPMSVPAENADFVAKFTPDGSALDYLTFLPGLSPGEMVIDSSGSAYVGGFYSDSYIVGGGYQNPNVSNPNYNPNQITVVKLSPDGSQVVYAAQIGPGSADLLGIYMNLAVDSQDSIYTVTGVDDQGYDATFYPTTTNAYQTTVQDIESAAVTKLSADGTSLVYSTFLGGTDGINGESQGMAVAVDSQGDAYIVGATDDSSFPTTSGALQPACGPTECAYVAGFVTKLNPTGAGLLYSTFFGTEIGMTYEDILPDIGPAIAVDASGDAYVAGTSINSTFPTPQIAGPMASVPGYNNGGATSQFAFLGEISNDGTQLLYLALLGDNNTTLAAGSVQNGFAGATSVAVDSAGNAYLTGVTTSSSFPVTSDAYQSTQVTTCNSSICDGEAFYTILNTTVSGNSSLAYSTYLGAATSNSIAIGTSVALDPSGNAYLGGVVNSADFPTTSGAFQATAPYGGGYVMKFGALSAPAASAISVVSGGTQSAVIGQAFANPLVVNVTDASGNPVSGATVTFTAPTSGASASLSSSTATTGSNGNASVTVTANGVASSTAYQVSASVASVTTPATFSLTNTQAATTLTVAPSSLSLVYGQPVTIAAAISPASVQSTAPTGSVAFYDNGTALLPDSTVSGAAASYTVNVPPVGSHPYSAQYLGDTNFEASALTGATSPVVVGQAGATLAGPAIQPVTLTAGQAGSIPVTIAGQYSGNGIATPSGSISYSVTGNAFLAGSAPIVSGSATIPVPSTVAAGQYTVMVSYAGDTNYSAATSINISLTVSSSMPQPVSVNDQETITVDDTETVNAFTLPAAINLSEPVAYFSTGSPLGFGGQPGSQTIALSNMGLSPLMLQPVTLSNTTAFSISALQCFNGATATSVPSGGFCTLTIAYTGSSPATDTGTLTFSDNAPLSNLATTGSAPSYMQSITLDGQCPASSNCPVAVPPPPTATVSVNDSETITVTDTPVITVTGGAPIANLSPATLSFAAQVSGTTAAAQTVTLSNTGNASLSINGSGISISGANATDFSESSPSCGSGVAAGNSCAISVTFTPSLSAGSETATLNVADNASGSPQQVQLSGVALPPPSVSCTIPTITLSGDSGTATITCTATDFTGTISLACNLPASLSQYITCSFSPSSLNFASSNTASTTLSINPAQSLSASLERKSWLTHASPDAVAFAAVLWLPGWIFVAYRKKGRSKRGILWLLILLCGLPSITSCGANSQVPATPPAGAYQASVVLTGPGLNETLTFTIQVL